MLNAHWSWNYKPELMTFQNHYQDMPPNRQEANRVPGTFYFIIFSMRIKTNSKNSLYNKARVPCKSSALETFWPTSSSGLNRRQIKDKMDQYEPWPPLTEALTHGFDTLLSPSLSTCVKPAKNWTATAYVSTHLFTHTQTLFWRHTCSEPLPPWFALHCNAPEQQIDECLCINTKGAQLCRTT